MKKNLLFILLSISFFGVHQLSAQCNYSTVENGTIPKATPTCVYQSEGGISPKEAINFDVVAGASYQVNINNVNWAIEEVSVFNDVTGAYVGGNGSTAGATYSWTSTFTGKARAIASNNCNNTSPFGWSGTLNSATLKYRMSSPAISPDASICSGSSTVISVNPSFPNTPGSLTASTAGGNGCGGGAMFNIVTNTNPVTITGITVIPNSTGTQTVNLYRKNGTYSGSETNSAAWILVGSYSITGTDGAQTYINTADFTIPASTTYGIYANYNADYTTGTNTYSDANITINAGVGLCSAFGGTNSSRTFNGIVHYGSVGGSWSPITGLSDPTASTTTASPTSTTTYTFTPLGCSSVSTKVNVSSGLAATATATAPSCNGGCDGSVDFNVSGGLAPYTLTEYFDGFDGTSLGNYVTDNIGNYTQNNQLTINAPGSTWDKYIYTNQTFAREAGKTFAFRYYNGTNNWNMIGWYGNGNTETTRYRNLVYSFYFHSAGINIYEDGSSRGTFTTNVGGGWAANTWYDCKIVLKATGADYYIKKDGETSYSFLYSSSHSSESNLRLGSTYLRYGDIITDNWTVYSGLQNDATFSLCAGSYNYTITDAAGCSVPVSATVPSAPSALSLTATVNNESCPGECDGSIVLAGSGGIAPYSYAGPSVLTDHFSGNDEGLILHLPLDNSTEDISPAAQTAGTNGGVTFADGAGDFSSSTGINMGTKGTPYLTAATTVSYWIYKNSNASRQNPFNHAYGGWGTQTVETNGAISWFFGNQGGNGNSYGSHQSPAGTITTGSWIHITCTRDPSTNTFTWYKNGTVLSSGSYNSSYPTIANQSLLIGDGYTTNINGKMSDFRIYNRVLSAEEVAALNDRSSHDYIFLKGGGTLSHNEGTIELNNNNDGWDMEYSTKETYTRVAGKSFQAQVKLDALGVSRSMFGWRGQGTSTTATYGNLLYAIYFNNSGNVLVYEGLTNRGTYGSFTFGEWYDIKIELLASGAVYYMKPVGATAWTTLYTSSFSTLSNLSPGVAHLGQATLYLDNLNVNDPMDELTDLCDDDYDYTVIDKNGCTATNTFTVGTDGTLSTAPTSIAGTSTICNGGSTSLTQSGGSLGTGGSYKWYTSSCGGTLVGTGNSINVSPTSTTTYYVRAEGTCNTTSCASQAVTVQTSPTAPTGISGTTTICSGGSTTLTATGGSNGSGATYQWYAGGCGTGSVLGTSSTLTVSPTSTTTYYVRRVGNTNCTNTTSCVSQAVTVQTSPTAPTGISGPTTICSGGSTTLTATGGSNGSGATYQWYAGGCGTGSVLGTSSTLTVSPTSTTTYYVRRVGNTNCTNTTSCVSQAVTVQTSPTAPTAITGTTFICAGSSTTLTATGGSNGSGATFEWFTGSCGGTLVAGAATASATVSPSVTTTYYARRVGSTNCTNTTSCASVTVLVNGSANTPSSATLPTAAGTYTSTCIVNDAAWHYFYTSSGELLAAIQSSAVQSLGNVTVSIEVGNPGPYGSGLPPGVCGYPGAAGGEYALARNWDITVGTQPVNPVNVKFYYEFSEIGDLTTNIASLPSNSANYINCWGNVNTEGDLMMTVDHGGGNLESPSIAFGAGPSGTIREVSFALNQFSSGKLHSSNGMHSGNSLPVELLSFEAKPVENEYVALSWITATEINNDGFELLRSTDGLNYEKIAWIAGNGNTNEQQSYSFDDYKVSNGTYYYKLRQIDFDGEFEDFNAIAVTINNKFTNTEIVVRPIPTSGSITLDIQSVSNSNAVISVFNYAGQKVLALNKEIAEGKNSFKIEEVKDLSSGIYYVNLTVDNKLFTKKFIISK